MAENAEIEILDYDVLIKIFSYLNFYDRVRVGLECSRWNYDEIDTQNALLYHYISDYTSEGLSTNIYKLLKQSRNLKHIELTCWGSRSCERFLKYVPKNSLKYLSISLRLQPTTKNEWGLAVNKVLKKMPRLKSLELQCVPIGNLSSIGGKQTLKALFIGMPDLKNIEFN
ncbi:hypothetical protein PV326_001306, partial [Microctonus aethiopoides]